MVVSFVFGLTRVSRQPDNLAHQNKTTKVEQYITVVQRLVCRSLKVEDRTPRMKVFVANCKHTVYKYAY